ncbi:MAG: polymer-forming cytoskeletal protein, partial [Methanosarcinales archaeon]|nr:polymer-forming cytoskeletal protein [Methanosarcinales archaeon]
METNFIKQHKDSNTFIIEGSSFFDTPVHLNGNLIVGDNTDFWSDLVVTGSLEMRKYVTIKGSVRAASAIIGAHS